MNQDTKSLTRHEDRHHNDGQTTKFKCSHSSYETKFKYYLNSHILLHKNVKDIKIYKCRHCTFQTKRKSTIKNHELLHENKNEGIVYECQIRINLLWNRIWEDMHWYTKEKMKWYRKSVIQNATIAPMKRSVNSIWNNTKSNQPTLKEIWKTRTGTLKGKRNRNLQMWIFYTLNQPKI